MNSKQLHIVAKPAVAAASDTVPESEHYDQPDSPKTEPRLSTDELFKRKPAPEELDGLEQISHAISKESTMSAKKEIYKTREAKKACPWHMNGHVCFLSPEANALPEEVKIALFAIDDREQRWCTSSYIFLGESIETTASRLELPLDVVKDNIIAGCRILLKPFPLQVPEDITSGPVRIVDKPEKQGALK